MKVPAPCRDWSTPIEIKELSPARKEGRLIPSCFDNSRSGGKRSPGFKSWLLDELVHTSHDLFRGLPGTNRLNDLKPWSSRIGHNNLEQSAKLIIPISIQSRVFPQITQMIDSVDLLCFLWLPEDLLLPFSVLFINFSFMIRNAPRP